MGSYFSSESKQDEKRAGRLDGYEVNVIRMRDNMRRLWENITLEEMKCLTENPVGSNYGYYPDCGSFSRFIGGYQKSSTSLLEHFKIRNLRDGCKILLSEEQYKVLKRFVQ